MRITVGIAPSADVPSFVFAIEGVEGNGNGYTDGRI